MSLPKEFYVFSLGLLGLLYLFFMYLTFSQPSLNFFSFNDGCENELERIQLELNQNKLNQYKLNNKNITKKNKDKEKFKILDNEKNHKIEEEATPTPTLINNDNNNIIPFYKKSNIHERVCTLNNYVIQESEKQLINPNGYMGKQINKQIMNKNNYSFFLFI